MLIHGRYCNSVTDFIAECETLHYEDRMVKFVPFAQMKINKPGIHFVSHSYFPLWGAFLCLPFFFGRCDPAAPHHGNVSDNPNLKGGLSEKIQ